MKAGKQHGSHHDTKDGRKPEEHLKHIVKRAKGGSVPKIAGVDEIGGTPEKPAERTPESGRKRGGAMKKKRDHEKLKSGGKVHGKHPGHRLDKRARGGRMTPKSPFSGADGPDLGYAKADLPSGSQGMGKDKS